MQFILGALSVLCGILCVGIVWMRSNINSKFDSISKDLRQINTMILTMPKSVQNIIHLGLRDGRVTTGLIPATISIRPEDFQIRADKLREKLLEALENESHPNTGTLAYCILNRGGIYEMLESKSAQESQKALARLLNNNEKEATKRFLETLAESVSHAINEKMASGEPVH